MKRRFEWQPDRLDFWFIVMLMLLAGFLILVVVALR